MKDLSLHIIDIIQNSVSAGARRIDLTVEEDLAADRLRIVITDNGRGMTPQQVQNLSDPFFTTRTTRKVGMGVPLFRQNAEQTEGRLTVDSTPGQGTTLTAEFKHSHVDRPPLGDLANSFILMVAANPDIEFGLRYVFNGDEYRFDTVEVKEALDGMPINNPSIVNMLEEMIKENIRSLQS